MPEAIALPAETWTPRRTFKGALVVLGVALAFVVLYSLQAVVFYLFVAIVIGTALRPLVAWVEQRGLSHGKAVIAVYSSLGLLLAGVAVLSVPLLVQETMALLDSLPANYHEFRTQFLKSPSPWVQDLAKRLPANLPWQMRTEAVVGQAIDQAGSALQYGGKAVSAAYGILAVSILSIVWSLNESRTIRSLLLAMPPERREAARNLLDESLSKVGGFIRGMGMLCLIVGALSLVSFLIIGLPYAVPLAVVAGLLEAVPYFGPTLGAIPAVLVALTVSPWKALAVIVAAMLVQFVENNILVPRVMGRSVGVNPVVSLLAIVGFGSLFGVMGVALAIPLASILQLVLDRTLFSRAAREPQRPAGRDAVSVLRYQAQELIHDLRMQIRDKPGEVSSGDLASGDDRLEQTIEQLAEDVDRSLATAEPPKAAEPPPPRNDPPGQETP